MDRLMNMKDSLMNAAQAQINGNLNAVDTEELGDVIDMIKDLAEAVYYCTITEAMGENKKEQYRQEPMYYGKNPYEPPYITYPMEPDFRDMDRNYGRMYYNGGGNGGNGGMSSNGQGSGGNSRGNSNSSNGGNRNYFDRMMPQYEYPQELLRDRREGNSPRSRKTYMESKEMNQDKETQMKELEKYLQELSQDVTEMIHDASPEEKQMLQQKLSMLVTKIK